MSRLLSWLHGHVHTPIPGAQQAAPFPIPPPNDHPYFNGMKDPVEGGFVTCQYAELARAKALASGNQGMITWAKSNLPFRYAIQAAQNQPEFAMSDADKFSNEENCQYAKMFAGGWLIGKSWCPQAFIATPPLPGEHILYHQGPALYGYASFDPTITPDKLLVLFADAYDQALKANGA